MSDVLEYKKVRVRKEHQCYFCHRKIPKGFSATHGKGIWQGDFFNVYFCNTCSTLTKEFPDYMTDSDGSYSEWEFEDVMSWYDCSTPLQLLNALRKEYKK